VTCLSEEQMLRLLDGDIAPNRAEGLREHVASCATCRAAISELDTLLGDIADAGQHDEARHVAQVMSRLDERRPTAARAARWKRPMAAAGIALALAAGGVVWVATKKDDAAFAARGSREAATLRRDVSVSLFTGTTNLVRLNTGATMAPDAALSAGYRNLHPTPVYLLLFAVDRDGMIHWLYPAFTDVRHDPASIALERTERELPFPTSVVLDQPARGPLRLVSLITERPLHVSDVERRAAAELSVDALERAFPGSLLYELSVVVQGE